MSPEQARGQPLDRRTGNLVVRLRALRNLTGRTPFAGDTISDTFAAILEREPDETMLPADTPVPIRRLLRRCLEKDRRRRLDSASDARLEIDDAMAFPAAETLTLAATPSRRVTPAAIAALAGFTVIAALVAWILMPPSPTVPVLPGRFTIVPAPAQPLNVFGYDRDLALSPDGRHLVYRAGGESPTVGTPLMVRATDELDARQLPGIFALGVFVSPDSRWIGFFTPTELKKVSIAGGLVRGAETACEWKVKTKTFFICGTKAADSPDWRGPTAPRAGVWRLHRAVRRLRAEPQMPCRF